MVEVMLEREELIIRVGGEEYAQYHFGEHLWKPYLAPIRADNGLSLVADAPIDYRHHHGLWIGHGRVNGEEFWHERYNSGRILHRTFEEVVSGDVGAWTETCEWVAFDGTTQLQDRRRFTFYDMPADRRAFDLDFTLSAPAGASVRLDPTNEAGLPQIRAAEGLTGRSGGQMKNSEGQTNESGTYRRSASWIDCSGRLGRHTAGIACFVHPHNRDYPSQWFTRDYGPFAPNSAFFQEEPVEITPERPLRRRYRIYTHSGDAAAGGVAAAWAEYLSSAERGEL